ncbi:MAG TPA: matrixin family metalloprotease [Caldilineaceae bacterium]|nr:matrixin family metalloprotease [Caldilineaceae bacterium]
MARSVSEIFEELKATKRQVEVHGKRYYIVEGDLILDEDKLLQYAAERAELEAQREAGIRVERQELVGILDNQGRKVRWKKGLVLTYTVKKSTFTTPGHYEKVVDAMRAATADWEAVCGVNFRHVSSLDDGAASNGETALFTVEGVNTRGQLIAAAFFPNDPPHERRVIIDPVFFASDLGFNPVGVLRHELGHVLGFRHEHIRSGAPPICPNEPLGNTIELTDYDPRSVMHYFCGGVGDKELRITDIDRQGAQLLYGLPDQEVAYYE